MENKTGVNKCDYITFVVKIQSLLYKANSMGCKDLSESGLG